MERKFLCVITPDASGTKVTLYSNYPAENSTLTTLNNTQEKAFFHVIILLTKKRLSRELVVNCGNVQITVQNVS